MKERINKRIVKLETPNNIYRWDEYLSRMKAIIYLFTLKNDIKIGIYIGKTIKLRQWTGDKESFLFIAKNDEMNIFEINENYYDKVFFFDEHWSNKQYTNESELMISDKYKFIYPQRVFQINNDKEIDNIFNNGKEITKLLERISTKASIHIYTTQIIQMN